MFQRRRDRQLDERRLRPAERQPFADPDIHMRGIITGIGDLTIEGDMLAGVQDLLLHKGIDL